MEITVSNLTVSYDGVHNILDSVNLEVEKGEFLAIVGRSGCGKSTLLHALAGFVPYTGSVQIPEDIGVVLQSYAIFPWLTVEKNIGFGLQRGAYKKKSELVQELMNRVGLTDHADKYPHQLSGGQQQRVALARALAPDPSLIVMDEPFGALDMFTRHKLQEWLAELSERDKRTFLFVTHNIEEAIFLADRIFLVKDGEQPEEIDIPIARPRRRDVKFTEQFVNLYRDLMEKLEKVSK